MHATTGAAMCNKAHMPRSHYGSKPTDTYVFNSSTCMHLPCMCLTALLILSMMYVDGTGLIICPCIIIAHALSCTQQAAPQVMTCCMLVHSQCKHTCAHEQHTHQTRTNTDHKLTNCTPQWTSSSRLLHAELASKYVLKVKLAKMLPRSATVAAYYHSPAAAASAGGPGKPSSGA